jgi:hypothetical protein
MAKTISLAWVYYGWGNPACCCLALSLHHPPDALQYDETLSWAMERIELFAWNKDQVVAHLGLV